MHPLVCQTVLSVSRVSFFRLISYGDKMLHDKFDGSKGFAIDGGLKDSQHIRRLATGDRKSTRLNSSHSGESRMPSSA